MHTDEAWLSGLSRAMTEAKSLSATEPFFDLVHRAPHALKIFFHIMQIFFIKLSGYSLFSVRLLSLLFGVLSLIFFYALLKKLRINPLAGTILLSVQIQFIYASHFARQEIQILALMLLSLLIAAGTGTSDTSPASFRKGLYAGIPIAAAVGFHPNAFIAAWPTALLIFTGILTRSRKPSEGAGYLIPPAASAYFFILLSRSFNSGFAADYTAFGAEVGVFDPMDVKLLGFDDFYSKLFFRISGTYYTPRILPVFILAAAALAAVIIILVFSRKQKKPVLTAGTAGELKTAVIGLLGVNAGIILIGKYSAPSVIFVIPFLIILIAAAIESSPSRPVVKKALYAAAAAILLVNSAMMISDELGSGENYTDFTQELIAAVPPLEKGESPYEHRVIGPLTAEYALEYGRLLDWRNLAELDDAGMTLEQYIQQNQVEYIIYTEELDVIYNYRPVWNIMYGNPTVFYIQLQDFLQQHCEPVSEFSSPGYGTRIAMHRFVNDWQVMVYRVVQVERQQ